MYFPYRKEQSVRYLRAAVIYGSSWLLFLREWWRSPSSIGAICASSRWLAKAIANQITIKDGVVLELGAGTGAVTAAMISKGIPEDRIIIIEKSCRFVDILHKKFPGVRVIHGDAADLNELLPDDIKVDAIVSSLPLRSLASELRKEIIHQWHVCSEAACDVVQYTYDIRMRINLCREDRFFSVVRSQIIWRNFPPARVLVAAPIALCSTISPSALRVEPTAVSQD